jgi:hypothetical protein
LPHAACLALPTACYNATHARNQSRAFADRRRAARRL